MSKGGRRADAAHLSQFLNAHLQSIRDTFQILDKPAPFSLGNIDSSEITKLADQISRQATVAGMLWSGETPDVKQAEENLSAYCNALHGFILIYHGSTAGAGPTLHASIRASVKQVVDSSLSLLTGIVSSYESCNSGQRSLIPQLSGSVWEACDALKKAPTTNCVAIGRAITQVAVSIKDVLREMREVKTCVEADTANGASNGSGDEAQGSNEDESSEDGELSEDLSPEEMGIAQLVIAVISDTLVVFKELLRCISTGLRKKSDHEPGYVDSLERLLSYCQAVGVHINDLGASVYPPQEISQMTSTVKKMYLVADEIRVQVGSIDGSPEGLLRALEGFKSSLAKLESGLSGDLAPEMAKLAV